MPAHRRSFQIISLIVVFTLLFSSVSLPSVSAQGGDGLEPQVNSQTGKVSFLGPGNGQPMPASKALGTFLRPQDPALALAKRFGPEFGLKNPERELSELKTARAEDGRITTRFQQNYEGIPVMGGELIVNTNESGDLYSMNGEVSSNISLSTQPTIDRDQAKEIALQSVAKWYAKAPEDFLASEPSLWIYDESLLRPSTRPAELVWRMDVTPQDASIPVRELVLVNAQRGNISLHFNQIDTAWSASTSTTRKNRFVNPTCSTQNGVGTGDLFFRPYVQYNCGGNSYGVGAGDFNSDGKTDAALSVNSGPGFQHTLLIFLQDNNGNLAQPVSYAAGERSEYLAVGDLNHDGRDDVVTLDNSDGTLSVYLQNNSGTLNNPVPYTTNTGPDAIAVGDITGDGRDDVVVSHWNSATIGIFTQKVDGTLNTMLTYPSIQGGRDDIAIGDVNGDGLNDVVKMHGQGVTETLLVYTQKSTHTLNAYYSISNCAYDCGGRGIEIGDITGDGRQDLVMSFGGNGNSAKIAVFPQGQNGSLQTSVIYASHDIPSPVEISDMNSDNKSDVIVLHSGWVTAGIYSQQINGTLGAETLYPIPYKSWYYPQDISIGDVNNDGLSDVLVADGTGLVVLYRRSPGPDTILSESGNNQAAALQTQFSNPLKVRMKDYLERPVTGATVTFTAPASGPSAVFANTGTNTAAAVTDANGIATSPIVSANNINGSYMIMASVSGLESSVAFQMRNVDPALPASISIVSGSNQSTPLQTPFSQLLKVKITNGLGQVLSGKTVTFTAPAVGASGTFGNTHTNVSSAVTDANGIATASAFTANTIRGGYAIMATVSGLASSANFHLFNGIQNVKTYTANNGTALPGTLLCDQTKPNCTNSSNPHADAAHKYALGTNAFYANQHGRDSIDNHGMTIISTVHYDSNYDNAFWSGEQMVYGDAYGFPLADDVVAHELTHGVTQYESNLFYYYQSGAINESFSDLWGEYYDQSNGLGTDTAGAKWQMGEDVSGLGPIRSMSNPPAFGDPDKMSSVSYYEGEDDSGGVHTNSGLNNKAVYLMVDGGTFNGKTITALGWMKTAAIYYEVNTKLLSSGADYSDLYYALQQACSNLIGQKGITAANCLEVKDAIDAVEMNGQPATNFNTDAPLCAANSGPSMVFVDNLENGTGNWTFNNGPYPRWQLDSPFGPFAQSGLHSLFANDYPDVVTDATARLKPMAIPANAYLHFAHAYGFESGYNFGDPTFYHFDGGVLEYSINNGSTWVDAGSLIDHNGYKGQLFIGAGNPLSGRSAFVGDSHGYISTRLNLSSLAGKTVVFRWRMGLDEAGYDWGWWVDNVRLYTCIPAPSAFNKTGPANGDTNQSTSPALIWGASSGATSYQYCYDSTNDNACTNWINNGTSTSKVLSGLSLKTTYYWHVRAVNSGGTTYANGSPTAFWLFRTLDPPGAFDKTSPSNGSTGVSLSPTLAWNSSPFAGSYQYCYDLINDNQCNRTWSSAASTSVNISNLGTNTTYYWQVRAVNAAGTTYADNQTWGSFTTTSTLPAGLTNIETFINTTKQGKYSLGAGQSLRESFAGVSNGPVKIISTTNIPLIGAERLIYKVNNTPTSFTEMMGLPNSQLDTTYWLPWYNNIGLDTQLRFANVSNATASVHVYIGGDEMDGSPFTLQAGESLKKSFPGIDDGPVKIESNQNIVAAARLIYKVNGTNTSFSEIMALPASQLDTTYWLPWYNNTGLDTQLRFANVTDQTASVHIYIGGEEMIGSPFTLLPGESTRKSFPGIDNGPVQIASDHDIVAAERLIYKANGIPTSFTEMMALPNGQLDTTYWLPWYNNTGLDTQLRFANATDQTATVHIYIGGEEMDGSPFTLEGGESTRISFPGIDDGPVQIVSDQNVVVAERLIYKVNNIPASFSEMMALPESQLDTIYWFPWYNNVDLDTQLRFGIP
jgi:Zn-dependent metalloprotease